MNSTKHAWLRLNRKLDFRVYLALLISNWLVVGTWLIAEFVCDPISRVTGRTHYCIAFVILPFAAAIASTTIYLIRGGHQQQVVPFLLLLAYLLFPLLVWFDFSWPYGLSPSLVLLVCALIPLQSMQAWLAFIMIGSLLPIPLIVFPLFNESMSDSEYAWMFYRMGGILLTPVVPLAILLLQVQSGLRPLRGVVTGLLGRNRMAQRGCMLIEVLIVCAGAALGATGVLIPVLGVLLP